MLRIGSGNTENFWLVPFLFKLFHIGKIPLGILKFSCETFLENKCFYQASIFLWRVWWKHSITDVWHQYLRRTYNRDEVKKKICSDHHIIDSGSKVQELLVQFQFWLFFVQLFYSFVSNINVSLTRLFFLRPNIKK